MTHIVGKYYDGKSTETRPAELELFATEVLLRVATITQHIALADITLEARLGNTPQQITWQTHERFVTLDHTGVEALQAELPNKVRLHWVHKLEHKLIYALAAVLIVVAASAAFAFWGIPLTAKYVAYSAPDSVSSTLGKSTLGIIDGILDPSKLATDRQAALSKYFRAHGDVTTIEYRDAQKLGANALTLSANTVVFTDQLVQLVQNDEQLLAVYLHELGHARLRHVERSILQNSAWVVLITVLVGDFSGAAELILTLPLVVGQAAYSRTFEREADQFAIRGLQTAGVNPGVLADVLERLHRQDEIKSKQDTATAAPEDQPSISNSDTADKNSRFARKVLEYLSSHPATAERSAYIRAADIRAADIRAASSMNAQ